MEPFYNFLDECDVQLSQLQKDNLVTAFVTLGAENVDDLTVLKEEDLTIHLPLIKCRKLLLHIKHNAASKSKPDGGKNSTCSTTTSTSLIESIGNASSSNVLHIPWERSSKGVKDCLNNKLRPTPKQRREVVRVLCDELLDNTSSQSPYRQDINCLTEMMVQKYPSSFRDHSLGTLKIDDGAQSLSMQIENRLHNQKRLSASDAESDGATSRKKKKIGYSNWGPDNLLATAEVKALKEKLLKMFEDKEENPEKLEAATKSCYPVLRDTINNQKYTVSDLKADWPIMFTSVGFKLHYKMLMDKSLDTLSSVVSTTAQSIIRFMQLEQCKNENLQVILKKMYKDKDASGSNQEEVIGMLCLIAEYFKDDINLLFLQVS